MLPGVYLLGNFWSLVFQIMQLQAGWQAVVILSIGIVFVSMGNFVNFFIMYAASNHTNSLLYTVTTSCENKAMMAFMQDLILRIIVWTILSKMSLRTVLGYIH